MKSTGVTADRYGSFLRGDGNVLDLDSGGGCTKQKNECTRNHGLCHVKTAHSTSVISISQGKRAIRERVARCCTFLYPYGVFGIQCEFRIWTAVTLHTLGPLLEEQLRGPSPQCSAVLGFQQATTQPG